MHKYGQKLKCFWGCWTVENSPDYGLHMNTVTFKLAGFALKIHPSMSLFCGDVTELWHRSHKYPGLVFRSKADQGNPLKAANCRVVFFSFGSRSSRFGRFFCPRGVGSMISAIGFFIWQQANSQCLWVVAIFWCVKSMLKESTQHQQHLNRLVHGTVWARERAAEGRLQGGLGQTEKFKKRLGLQGYLS